MSSSPGRGFGTGTLRRWTEGPCLTTAHISVTLRIPSRVKRLLLALTMRGCGGPSSGASGDAQFTLAFAERRALREMSVM